MTRPVHPRVAALAAALCAILSGARAGAQRAGPAPAASQTAAPVAVLPGARGGAPAVVGLASDADVERVLVAPGRVRPLTLQATVSRVMVADTSVADAVIVSDRDLVFNGRKPGETDVLVWSGGRRAHYRAVVAPPADRPQVMLAVRFAEVRRDMLKSVGVSFYGRRLTGGANGRVGSGIFNTDNVFTTATNGAAAGTATGTAASAATAATTPLGGRNILLPGTAGFGTFLTDLGARGVLAMIDLEEQRGNARTLAEPTLMAGNRDSASFLAGGEYPVPAAVTTGTPGSTPFVSIVFKEFGVRLAFTPEILNDSIVKLRVRPEVSSLDYANAVTLSGVKIPALRTRRMESTVDVLRDQSLVISGLMDDERQKVRTGIPGLIDLPILGPLFSSTRWQRNETELLVVVTPVVVDPSRPRPQDVLRFKPDSALPAREAIDPRLAAPPALPATPSPKQP